MLYRAFRQLERKVAALEEDVPAGVIKALDDIDALTDNTAGETADGTIAAITDLALDTGDTYSDSAVNAAVNAKLALIRDAITELSTQLNAILAALKPE